MAARGAAKIFHGCVPRVARQPVIEIVPLTMCVAVVCHGLLSPWHTNNTNNHVKGAPGVFTGG